MGAENAVGSAYRAYLRVVANCVLAVAGACRKGVYVGMADIAVFDGAKIQNIHSTNYVLMLCITHVEIILI